MWILRPQTLHRLRNRKKLTMEELANRAGISEWQLLGFDAMKQCELLYAELELGRFAVAGEGNGDRREHY